MKILRMPQGSPEWHAARLARPTASQAHRIVTPAQVKLSKARFGYQDELVQEYITGEPHDIQASPWMERGTEQEDDARDEYALVMGVEVEQVGFCLHDVHDFGCSPDGLVNPSGLVEIKIPSLKHHIGYLRSPGDLEDAYRAQAQAQMYVTERAWCDLWSFNDELPPVRRRVARDAEYIAALDAALGPFLEELEAAKATLADYRRIPPTVEAVQAAGAA